MVNCAASQIYVPLKLHKTTKRSLWVQNSISFQFSECCLSALTSRLHLQLKFHIYLCYPSINSIKISCSTSNSIIIFVFHFTSDFTLHSATRNLFLINLFDSHQQQISHSTSSLILIRLFSLSWCYDLPFYTLQVFFFFGRL